MRCAVYPTNMPHIRFTVEVDCEDQEPSRIIPAINGTIFEYEGETDKEVSVGNIHAYLVLRSRAMNEGVSLFDAMDSISQSVFDCYEALFDVETDEWSLSVEALYSGEIIESDVLFIESVELDAPFRGKGIGAQIVRETIATFASSCGLVACKPFPLQYSNWQDEAHNTNRQEPGFEEKRVADFARVAKFWTDLGFRKLHDSDFHTYAPELIHQTDPGSDAAPSIVPYRVPRGRRRETKRSSRG
jgi:GNAT superfamily N-acetyltransferase